MYIDNSVLIREVPYLLYHKFNMNGENRPVYSSYYISLRSLNNKINNKAIELKYDFLSEPLFFKQLIPILTTYLDITVIYTKLDLTQTSKQIKSNKYFKTFIGKRQIILEEN